MFSAVFEEILITSFGIMSTFPHIYRYKQNMGGGKEKRICPIICAAEKITFLYTQLSCLNFEVVFKFVFFNYKGENFFFIDFANSLSFEFVKSTYLLRPFVLSSPYNIPSFLW